MYFFSIHLCVTYLHTKDGVADKFLSDVSSVLSKLLLDPGKVVEGKVCYRVILELFILFFFKQMAMYGMAQALPDRSLVGEITRCWIDSMYYTPAIKENGET